MTGYFIRPLTQDDVNSILENAGGSIAHPDANKRTEPGGDFILGEAAIELKLLEEDGFEKSQRQRKLAALFQAEGFQAPVVVLDRHALSAAGQRTYDRAIEGPIKAAVAKAREQLKQTRKERADTEMAILWIVNNGYTALSNDEVIRLVAHRARNDTNNIDGVLVGGCYFYSDDFDNFFLWPLTYVPIRLKIFPSFDALHAAWGRFAQAFMTQVAQGHRVSEALKGPVIDTHFEVDGVTFVKPAPPIGRRSDFYCHGRPRKNSSGLNTCPPVALTFPGLSQVEWKNFRRALPQAHGLSDSYESWLRHERAAREQSKPLRPFVRMAVSFEGWQSWMVHAAKPTSFVSVAEYANALFQERIENILAGARELKSANLVPRRYILAVTDQIGQDEVNDLSCIYTVEQHLDGQDDVRPIFKNLRIFHTYAVVLAAAYGISRGIESVMWARDTRYAWT